MIVVEGAHSITKEPLLCIMDAGVCKALATFASEDGVLILKVDTVGRIRNKERFCIVEAAGEFLARHRPDVATVVCITNNLLH